MDGFSNAQFKSFSTSLEAEQYMNSNTLTVPISNNYISKCVQEENISNLEPSKEIKMNFSHIFEQRPLTSVDNLSNKASHLTNLQLLYGLIFLCVICILFITDSEDDNRVSVYTDGSCRKGQHGNMAGYGVYWGDNSPLYY